MTGRTHDVGAFTALHLIFLALPLQSMTLATAVVAFGANFIGGLFPDIDQPTSDLWDNFRGGEIVARFLCPLFGGHRHFSHSIIGIITTGFLLDWMLQVINHVVLVDMRLVWWCFMIGVVSHILMDMPTKDGVPLLWPLKLKFGFPPFRFMRIRSGKWVENLIIFPGLLLFNFYLLYNYGEKALQFLRTSIY